MATRSRIHEQVEKTLASMGGLERLEASPAFLARLQARIAAAGKARPDRPAHLSLLGPILRPALLALLVLINIVTIAVAAKPGSARNGKEKAAIKAMAAEYSMSHDPDDLYYSGEETGE